MEETFIGITNYRVVNNIGRRTGDVIIKLTDILLVVGIRVTVDGKSDTLVNIFNNSGLMCITDKQGWEKILEVIGQIKRPINTYTVINGVSRPNDTFYLNYSTITKLLPISTKEGKRYQCTTSSNLLLFTTDEEGAQSITMSRFNNIKQIQGCDGMSESFAVDLGGYIVEDGLTYSMSFNGGTKGGCYTILGGSLNLAQDNVLQLSGPTDCLDCKKVAP